MSDEEELPPVPQIIEPPVPQIIEMKVLQDRRRKRGSCWHRRFEIDREGGAVFCQDCDQEIPAFEALCIIARQDSTYLQRYFRLREEIVEIQKYKPWLKAVKRLEHIWRGKKMLPCCPHCNKGIKAEDLAASGLRSIKYVELLAGEPANKPAGPELVKR